MHAWLFLFIAPAVSLAIFQYSIGDTDALDHAPLKVHLKPSILHWRCSSFANSMTQLVANNIAFQYSIGDAEYTITAGVLTPGHLVFQYSIGDAATMSSSKSHGHVAFNTQFEMRFLRRGLPSPR